MLFKDMKWAPLLLSSMGSENLKQSTPMGGFSARCFGENG